MSQLGFNQAIYREVLDEDRRINKRVFEMSIKDQNRFDEISTPANKEINAEVLNKIQLLTDNLISELQRVVANGADYANKYNYEFHNKKGGELDNITSTNDVLKFYNQLMYLIKTPQLEQQTKRMGETSMQEILPLVRTVIDNYKLIISSKLHRDANDHNLPLYVMQYSLYKLIQDRLNDRNYNVITYGDIQNEFRNAVRRDFSALNGDQNIMRYLNNEFKKEALKLNLPADYDDLDPDEQDRVAELYNFQPAVSSAYANRLRPYELEPSLDPSLRNPFLSKKDVAKKNAQERKKREDEEREAKRLEKEAERVAEQAEKDAKKAKKEEKKRRKAEEEQRKIDEEEQRKIDEEEARRNAPRPETKKEKNARKKQEKAEAEAREKELQEAPPAVAEGNGRRKFYMKAKKPALQFNDAENESYFY